MNVACAAGVVLLELCCWSCAAGVVLLELCCQGTVAQRQQQQRRRRRRQQQQQPYFQYPRSLSGVAPVRSLLLHHECDYYRNMTQPSTAAAASHRLRRSSVDVTTLARSEGGASPSRASGRPSQVAHSRSNSSAGDGLAAPATAAPLLATASATVSGMELEPAVAAAVGGSARSAVATPRETAESLDDDFYASSMSVLCPLNDEFLPMDASNLKSKQVGTGLGCWDGQVVVGWWGRHRCCRVMTEPCLRTLTEVSSSSCAMCPSCTH